MTTSAVGSTKFTLVDAAKEYGPDGKALRIAQLLTQKNEVLLDMFVREGNKATGERASQQTGLPESYYRLLNQGVPASKDTSIQVDFECSILEARSEVDKDLAEMNGDLAGFRFRRAKPRIESMNQKTAYTLWYGTAASPEEFIGLSSYYNAISGAANADNIIDGGGSGSNNMSIWLIGWGEDTIGGVYPKGSKAGLQHEDLGLGDAFDASQRRFRAYMDWWQWKLGLFVIDWRYAVRICNIDVPALLAGSVAAADLAKLMSQAIDIIPSFGDVRAAFYMNRIGRSALRNQLLSEKRGTAMSFPQAARQLGDPVRPGDLDFLGIPVRLSDQLLKTEARVV